MLYDNLTSYSESKPNQSMPMKSDKHQTNFQNEGEPSKLGKYKYCCQESECGKIFVDAHLLREHQQKHAQSQQWVLVKCSYCPKKFATRKGLKQHLPLHTGQFPYYCFECQEGFCQKSGWIAHERRKHAEKVPTFRCTKCAKAFSFARSFERHKRTHEGKERFTYKFHCKQCNKMFTSKAGLKRHHMMHEGKRWECELCPETYATKSGLQRHSKNKH